MGEGGVSVQDNTSLLGSQDSRIAHLFFDLDGTLVNTTEGIVRAYKHLLQQYALPLRTDDELRRWIGPPVRTVIREFLGPVSSPEIEKGVSVMREYYFASGWKECHLYDGIAEATSKLAQRGMKLYVVTAKNGVMSEKVLTHVGLRDTFLEIMAPGLEADRDKGEMLQELITRRGINPLHGVMIGDSKYDVEAAHRVGMRALAVSYGFGSLESLEALSPWKLCHSPMEILELISAR